MKALPVAMKALLGSGALLLILGLIIWVADAHQLVGVHIALGVVLVLSLWTICAIAGRSGVAAGSVAFAAAWGVLIVVLGLSQEELVPGDLHWTIQVLHVVISMGAIWWGKRLAKMIGSRRALSPSSQSALTSSVPH
ncbi:MAG TPA: hypothetical protein VFT27_10000 [Actinomycetota bacterium]|nr:hypothetical protein [Actinomycetota bacterium]